MIALYTYFRFRCWLPPRDVLSWQSLLRRLRTGRSFNIELVTVCLQWYHNAAIWRRTHMTVTCLHRWERHRSDKIFLSVLPPLSASHPLSYECYDVLYHSSSLDHSIMSPLDSYTLSGHYIVSGIRGSNLWPFIKQRDFSMLQLMEDTGSWAEWCSCWLKHDGNKTSPPSGIWWVGVITFLCHVINIVMFE